MFSRTRAPRFAFTTILAVALTGVQSCGSDTSSSPTNDVASVQITVAGTNPRVGETTVVSAVGVNAGGVAVPGAACTYTSSTPAVAAVVQSGANGIVTGITAGTTTITATCGARANTVTITVRPPLVTLTLTKLGAGPGGLFASPAGPSYDQGTVVTMTATPVSGSVFMGWGGACAGVGACVVAMTSNLTVTGTFDPRFAITVTNAGSGTGTVSANPAAVNYAPNTNVTLTAQPAAGSAFAGWSGDCAGAASCLLVMDGNKAVTATFNAAPFAGRWGGSWVWSGPGSNGCIFSDGGTFSMTLTQTGSTVSGSATAAGVQYRLDVGCVLESTTTETGTITGTSTGTSWPFTMNLAGGALVFSGTATLNVNSLTAAFTRSTGGNGTFTLTRQ